MRTNEKVYIYIDDVRLPKNIPYGTKYVICQNYKTAIEALKKHISFGYKIIVDFDHDLGEDKSGYDIAKWIVQQGYSNMYFKIHSMNPVGAKNIRELLTHYGYKEIFDF